jgi:pantetheine-phosphate adenylyltransferase
MPTVRVVANKGLTVDAAREHGAQVLVKGLRAITDFNSEFDMALMNRKMAPEVESSFLMTSLDYLFVSATRIRELASFGYPIEDLVPPVVADALREKFKHR